MSEQQQRQGRLALVVDDDESVRAGLAALLEMSDWETASAATAREGYQLIFSESPDLVLLDVNLPDVSGIEMLDQIKSHYESLPVVMISGQGDIPTVVKLMEGGAETFLEKPFDHAKLDLILKQAERTIDTRREIEALRRAARGAPSDESDTRRFVGISQAATTLNDLISRVAPAPSPVLIQGESGSGKGLVARLIHEASPRRDAPMVDLNCAGLSKELLESELFGHEKGAFTGAAQTKQGLFEIASKGTVFLDEIGELELSIQARLLKAIEEKRFRRVGGVRDLTSEFRLIAATNRDLAEEVAEGRFRQDLFYRLDVVSVQIPPLRDRIEDVSVIAEHLLRELAYELGVKNPSISDRAMQELEGYPWPGNVRELRNTLERALLMSPNGTIRANQLNLGNKVVDKSASPSTKVQNEWDVRPLDDVMKEYVRSAVEATGGNRRKAARLLEISPSTLYSKLKE